MKPSPNIIGVITSRRRACSTYGDRKGVHRVLVGKREGMRPLETPKLGWEDNIKIDL